MLLANYRPKLNSKSWMGKYSKSLHRPIHRLWKRRRLSEPWMIKGTLICTNTFLGNQKIDIA
jgi:hypothetical protein